MCSGAVGAGYLSALLAGDEHLAADYLIAFTPAEILTAITGPLRLLAMYLSYHTQSSPTEIGDALVYAALKLEREGVS